MRETVDYILGSAPLLVSLPHGGTYIPAPIANQMNAIALTDHGVMYGASEFAKKA